MVCSAALQPPYTNIRAVSVPAMLKKFKQIYTIFYLFLRFDYSMPTLCWILWREWYDRFSLEEYQKPVEIADLKLVG